MKGRRTSFADAPCPIARVVGLIGDPWSLLIVRDALMGAQRFGEFQRSLGLAKNILAERLRRLVAEGILTIEAAPDDGRHKLYRLTDKGRDLRPALRALRLWGETHVAVTPAVPGTAPAA